MFKVGDIRKSAGVTSGKGVKKASGDGSFADYLNDVSATENSRIQTTTAMTSADAIFAAQMVDGDEERQIRKRVLKKGNNLLDKLEEIRNGLLQGEISKDKLIEISRMVKQKDFESSDKKLQDIMQEIELRVEVELAKLMR